MGEEVRVLYVPPDTISWEAMFDHGLKLLDLGFTVHLHEHSFNVPCGQSKIVGPNGAVPRCGQLTAAEGAATLEPVSENDN